MDRTQAARPFNSSVFGTLREKNNTIMNFVKTLEEKQRENKEREVVNLPDETVDEKPVETREHTSIEYTGKQQEDLKGNPLNLSGERSNVLTEGLFIGSIYVGREGQRDKQEDLERNKSWRVKI